MTQNRKRIPGEKNPSADSGEVDQIINAAMSSQGLSTSNGVISRELFGLLGPAANAVRRRTPSLHGRPSVASSGAEAHPRRRFSLMLLRASEAQ